MNTATINKISDQLKVIPEKFANDILQYLEFLFFKSSQSETDFELTNEQIEILNERSKTSLEDCFPAEDVLTDLKKKYGV